MALKIGLQMYSVREHMAEDPFKTFELAAKAGYKYFELANLNAREDFGCGFHAPAKELKKHVEDLGCEIVAAHIKPFDDTNVDRVLEYHAELGTKYLMSKPNEGSRAQIESVCDRYAFLAEKCRAVGIQHALHVGYTPFIEAGVTLLDVVFENTRPEDLKFEIDSYWAMRSGIEPKALIHKYGNRIVAMHEKDLPTDFRGQLNINDSFKPGTRMDLKDFFSYVKKEDFCEIGTGCMPIQEIIDTINQYTNAEYLFLEQDFTKKDEIESIQISFDNLKKYHGVVY